MRAENCGLFCFRQVQVGTEKSLISTIFLRPKYYLGRNVCLEALLPIGCNSRISPPFSCFQSTASLHCFRPWCSLKQRKSETVFAIPFAKFISANEPDQKGGRRQVNLRAESGGQYFRQIYLRLTKIFNILLPAAFSPHIHDTTIRQRILTM